MQRFLCGASGIVATALLAVSSPFAAGADTDKFLDKITQALPDKAPAQPKQPRKILIYSKTAGFRHSSIPVGIKAVTMMGDKTGAYTAFATEDESYFEPDRLKTSTPCSCSTRPATACGPRPATRTRTRSGKKS